MVWQHPENVIDPRMKMKNVLAEAGDISGGILEGLGIRVEWMGRFPHELSGGEMQRFSIARALGEKTRFMLADEISAMLDAVAQAQVWSFLLGELERRDIGLLAVSHSESLLRRICGENVLYLKEKMD
jgi:peptide/nickel transport system ATP-binding protein